MNKENILFVFALEQEVPNIKLDNMLFTGIGKVNAAHKLTKYLCENPHIELVVNYGTAGRIEDVKRGELIAVNRFIQGDYICDLPGHEGEAITFMQWLPWSIRTCATHDRFIEGGLEYLQLRWSHKVNCVDMEAYALAQVCSQMGKNFHCYKYISDDACEDASEDWSANVSNGEVLFTQILLNIYNMNSTPYSQKL